MFRVKVQEARGGGDHWHKLRSLYQQEGGGLWFTVIGSWIRRVGGPSREVLWH